MNNDEAKFILSAYRPTGDDASDPRFAEAITQAERDPELAHWFEAERRFDAAFANALEAVPLPRDLRAKILAGGEVSRPSVWVTRRQVLALAAGIVLLAAAAGLWFNRVPGLDRWQRDALTLISKLGSGSTRFDLVNQDAAVLQEWLRERNAPAPEALPAALRSLPALGCKTIDSEGHAVSIICFKMGANESIHLVVTDENTLSRPPPSEPRFVRENGWATASWSAHGQACMLATKGTETELREVVRSVTLAMLTRERFARESTRPRLATAPWSRLP